MPNENRAPMHRRRQRTISAITLSILLALTALHVLPARAQAPADPADLPQAAGVSARLTTGAQELTVGDPAVLLLEVTHPADQRVIVPELDAQWGDFEVRSQSPVELITHGDGTATTRQEIEVALFAPGTFSSLPLRLVLSDAAGRLSQVLAPPATLTVRSILAAGDDQLRDIKPQAELPLPRAWWAWAAAGLLAVAIAGGAWQLYRMGRRRTLFDRRPPHQVAHDELARIAGLHLPAAGRFQEHYARVSDCLRTYIHRELGIAAGDMTTAELRRALSRMHLSVENVQRLLAVFVDADLVKFSRVTPSREGAARLVEQAQAAVRAIAEERADALPGAPELGATATPTGAR